ncbi:MAG: 2,5-diamino-6-(ribosylamino)-4(3H)-pyrimidinone 5'-phosphate reductase [Archaeoglobaceae archaeon]|nr:2,5-diamino-6-(ribosylamino)-4(3H)-pyrimidinone 5'-phosphate reductase [Archaeoglobaceae archaeon]
MRPHVVVNLASSIDGKISNEKRVQLRISCEEDLKRVDELRASFDGIMVGIGTILSDNPKLNVKNEDLRKKRVINGKNPNPTKIVVDSECRIPENAEVFSMGHVIVAVSRRANKENIEKISKKAEVVVFGKEKVDLVALLDYLYKKGINKLLIEGGGTLIYSMLLNDLVDEIFIYYAPILIGGANSPTICDGRSFENPVEMELVSVERLEKGFLVHLTRKKKL